MFLDYYRLRKQPFCATPDPAHVFPSRAHREVLDAFTESIVRDRGNLALLAEPGLGKTTLLHLLLERLCDSSHHALLFQKNCNSSQIFQFLLGALRVDTTGMELAAMQGKFNQIWFAEMLAGKRIVLLFDDAEDLDDAVVETIRQLSRYETPNTKWIQVVLAGQPRLQERLDQGKRKQWQQRLAMVQQLRPFSPMETASYVRHRLKVAGYYGEALFDPEALAVVAVRSECIPQNINRICSRAMLEAYARGLHAVSAEIVEKADQNLSIAASVNVVTLPGSSEGLAADDPGEGAVGSRKTELTYKSSSQVNRPRSGLWVGAIVAILLSAGLALPHGMLRGMTQMMRGQATEIKSPVQQEEAAVLVSPDRKTPDAPEQPVVAPSRDLSSDTTRHDVAKATPDAGTDHATQLSLTRELGLKINRIVIDPGHGGNDTGATGPHGLLEKDVCLEVALRLGQLIEENIPGAEVIYTRKDDSYVPLEARTTIANDANADLFISIHANSSGFREVRGVETYYLSLAASKDAKELAIRENALTQSSLHDLPDLVNKITRNEKISESRSLAVEIQCALSGRLQLVNRREKDRGVKQAPFMVLTGANMPAVLSEISFVSNATDESLLLGSSQRERVAEGLYRGIAVYLDGLHGVTHNKQKLVTENRPGTLSGFDKSPAEPGRNPL